MRARPRFGPRGGFRFTASPSFYYTHTTTNELSILCEGAKTNQDPLKECIKTRKSAALSRVFPSARSARIMWLGKASGGRNLGPKDFYFKNFLTSNPQEI